MAINFYDIHDDNDFENFPPEEINKVVVEILKLFEKSTINPYYLERIIKTIQLFNKRDYARIIAALNIIGFSTIYDISKILNLYRNNTTNIVLTLSRNGILTQINKNSDDYNIKIRFWKNQNHKTRRLETIHKIELYEIKESEIQLVALASKISCCEFLNIHEIIMLEKRKESYENFKKSFQKSESD